MAAPDAPDPRPALAALLTARPDEPGLALAVTRGDAVWWRGCAGLADLPHAVPVGPDTAFHVVSVTKTFTAALIVVFAARGRLSLDDDVRRHVPEVPPPPAGGGPVTIRHLLSMTSGLRDAVEIERLRGIWHPSPRRAEDFLALAARQDGVNAPAGSQYGYCNLNFVLLEEIVRRATGQEAEDARRRALYEPLGLAATRARPHEGIVVPRLAAPYARGAGGEWVRATDLLGISGDALTTTLEDLARWLLALRGGTVAGVRVRDAMAERARLRDGRPIHYGLGLAVRRYRGLTVLCHSGMQPGYRAHLAYLPERDVGIAVLANRDDIDAARLARAAMDCLLGEDASAPVTPQRAHGAAPGPGDEALRALAGTWVDAGAGEWLELAVEDGVVRGETLGDSFALYAGADGAFRDGDDYVATVPVELRVVAGIGAAPPTCDVDIGGLRVRPVRCASPALDTAALAAYAGRYESAALASRHDIALTPGGLRIQYGLGVEADRAFPMTPVAPDVFLVRPTAPGVAHRHLFVFERDAAGHVVGARVTMERLKGVRISRAG